jgi:methyltransferase (TIGR00027 family)
MFKSLKRITYQVEDLEKAKLWYNAVLDAYPAYETPFVAIYKVGDCSLSLSKSKGPLPESSERMEVYWEVENIEAASQRLTRLGARAVTPVTRVLTALVARVTDPFGNLIGLTADDKEHHERTVENQPSETAMTVAFCRALASMDDREDIKGPDNLAEMFLTDEAKKALQDRDSRKWAVQNLVTSPLYGYFIARTAFLDSIFEKACLENIPQIVMLGAGYDTRPYRFFDKIRDSRVFEVDFFATQQRKREILEKSDVRIPGTLSFVPIRLRNEKIHAVLSEAGFDQEKKTLFIWEGVTYYLPGEDVRKTLAFFSRCSPEGSTVCFDYMTKKLESVNSSEPFLFWADRKEIENILSSFHISMQVHREAGELQRKYLTCRDGSTEKILPYFCLVQAVVHKKSRP